MQENEGNSRRGFRLPGMGLVDDIREIAARAPSEATMLQFLEALPRIEALMASGNMEAVQKLADKLPDASVLQALTQVMPNQHDLNRLLEAMKGMPSPSEISEIIAAVRNIPSTEEMHHMADLLEKTNEFLKALKGL